MLQRCQPYAPASFSPGDTLGCRSCHRRSRPKEHSTPGRINSMTPIWNRTRDLPAWSAVPQSTAQPRAFIMTKAQVLSARQYKSFALQIMLIIMSSFHGLYQNFYCKVILYPVKKPNNRHIYFENWADIYGTEIEYSWVQQTRLSRRVATLIREDGNRCSFRNTVYTILYLNLFKNVWWGKSSKVQIVLNSGSMFLGTLVLACQTTCYRKPEDHNRNLHWSGMSNLVLNLTLWLCIHFFPSTLSDTGSLLSTGNSSKKLIHSHKHSSDLKGIDM